jgi:hypothetical protein
VNNVKVLPLIFLGTAIGQIRRGEDGLAIMLLCGVAVVVIVDWVFAEIDDARERKRREQKSQGRHPNF